MSIRSLSDFIAFFEGSDGHESHRGDLCGLDEGGAFMVLFGQNIQQRFLWTGVTTLLAVKSAASTRKTITGQG